MAFRRPLEGRSPYGERGLKYALAVRPQIVSMSLPLRGAWIEIQIAMVLDTTTDVAPLTGSVD